MICCYRTGKTQQSWPPDTLEQCENGTGLLPHPDKGNVLEGLLTVQDCSRDSSFLLHSIGGTTVLTVLNKSNAFELASSCKIDAGMHILFKIRRKSMFCCTY